MLFSSLSGMVHSMRALSCDGVTVKSATASGVLPSLPCNAL